MRQWETACEPSQRGFRSEDTEVPAIGRISHDSDSERLTKVASKKHSIFRNFRKTEIAKCGCEPKGHGLLAGNALEIKNFGKTNLVT